jgi:hypothetical protein
LALTFENSVFPVALLQFAVKETALTLSPVITKNKSIVNTKKSIFLMVVGISTILLGINLILEKDANVELFFSITLIGIGLVDLMGGLFASPFLRSRKLKKSEKS